jgi:predicted dehydrogenase
VIHVKQIAQRPKDGVISVVDVPAPALSSGWVLVANRASLISLGTERTKVETGEKNLLKKARARPDLVRKVVERALSEGIRSTLDVTLDRLAALTPIGYSAAGCVLEVGEGVEDLAPEDRVACGGEAAGHAEILAVPKNLIARIPEDVTFEDAAYTTIGAIALHAVRQADAGIGEWVGVVGLGLVGQLVARTALAGGCRVVGIDVDEAAVELARKVGITSFGRDDPGLERAVRALTGGLGLDAVLLCASSAAPDPLVLAAQLARDRGRIVVVGATRIDVDRAPMYEKELELRMSRSYGPGRYDREYEDRGRDLPPGYVRWTEQRNMQAFLELVASGAIRPSELTTHRFEIDDAPEAYRLITHATGTERPFGVLLTYEPATEQPAAPLAPQQKGRGTRAAGVALIGPGVFARATLIPALKAEGARLVAVASGRGLAAADAAVRLGFERAAASVDEILADDDVGAVVVASRHGTHAALTAAALRAGKAVFVEKPLALTPDQLDDIESALALDSVLMVGFNRRFAPLVERLRAELGAVDDLVLSMRTNAGSLPNDHWLHDPEDGGGRLLGEGCHFVDLLSHLAASRSISAHAVAVPQPGRPIECSDSFTAHIRYSNAVASLVYSGGGDPKLPKERLEVFGGGVAAVLDDFRVLGIARDGKRREWKSSHDKGHRAEINRFLAAAAGTAEPPRVESYLDSTRLTLALAGSLRSGRPVDMSTSSDKALKE